jgi:hypothetical protein
VSSPEAELRAASDTLVTSLDRLAVLEAEKRRLQPDDPRLLELASEVEVLAAEVLQVAEVQSQLVETTHVMSMTDEGEAPSGPIGGVGRTPHDILEEWRAAERSLTEAPPGSPEAAEALVRARQLRAEYQRAYQDTRRKARDS